MLLVVDYLTWITWSSIVLRSAEDIRLNAADLPKNSKHLVRFVAALK